MSKSKRNKKKRQKQRALQGPSRGASQPLGSPRWIEQCVRDPAAAARAVIRGRRKAQPLPENTLEPVLGLCQRLRHNGKLELARELATLCVASDERFRWELALGAFAAGDDASALATSEGLPALADVVKALVGATRGRYEATDTRLPLPGSQGSLFARLARATHHLHHVDSVAARSALRGAPRCGLQALDSLRELCEHAGDGAGEPGPTGRVFRTLARSADVECRRATLRYLARHASDFDRVSGRLGLGAAVAAERETVSRAVLARLRGASAEQIAGALARWSAGGLDPSQRGLGHLWAGFAQIPRDPTAALRELEQALAEGADLEECLRGRALAMEARFERDDRRKDGVEAARTWDRLCRSYERDPRGLAAAAVAAALGATTWAMLDAPVESGRALERALGFADRLGSRGEPLFVTLAPAVMSDATRPGGDPERGLAHLERALSSEPRDSSLWFAKLELLGRVGRDSISAQLEAVRATGDEDLAARVRQTLRQDPDAWTAEPELGSDAGELALGWLRRSRQARSTAQQLAVGEPGAAKGVEAKFAEARQALERPARAALDFACVSGLWTRGDKADAKAVLERCVADADEQSQAELLAAALVCVPDETDRRALMGQALHLVSVDVFLRLYRLALATDAYADARWLLAQFAVKLGRNQLKRCQRLEYSVVEADSLTEVANTIEARLAPLFSLRECWGSTAGLEDVESMPGLPWHAENDARTEYEAPRPRPNPPGFAPGREPRTAPDRAELVRGFLKHMAQTFQLPVAPVRRLTEAQLVALYDDVMLLTQSEPGPESMPLMVRLLDALGAGVTPPGPGGGAWPPPAGGTAGRGRRARP